MLLQPKYAENIIVATVYKGVFRWYVTDYAWWFLDYRRWKNLLYEPGDKLYEERMNDFSGRFGIDIVDGENVYKFFEEIKDYEVSTQELREFFFTSTLVQDEYDCGEGVSISLYYDFDQKIFVDFFPEPLYYFECIPDGWREERKSAKELLKSEDMYWMLDEENMYDRFRGDDD